MNYPKNRYTGPKPWMNEEWLYNEYIVKDRGSSDIAEEYGCKPNTIQQWLCKFKIKKEHVKHKVNYTKPYQQYEYLFHNYVELNRSIIDIARENNVSDDAVRRFLLKYNIETHRVDQHKFKDESTVNEIIDLYYNEMWSANKISQKFNTSHKVILDLLRDNGVEIRDLSESQLYVSHDDIPDEFYDADYLNREHWENNKSCKEIGENLNITPGAIRRQMHRLGLETKNCSESKIGLMVGDKHPNWKGGITPLYLLLREYSRVNLSPSVFKRDNYTCQLCGTKKGQLHCHHIVPFSEIVKEIIAEHPEFDLADSDDIQSLYDIITHDKRFLDTDNLITYCRDCHLFKIHGYKRRETISNQYSTEE